MRKHMVKKSVLGMYIYLYIMLEVFILPEHIMNISIYILSVVLFLMMLLKPARVKQVMGVLPMGLAIIASTVVNYGIESRINILAMMYALSIIDAFYVVRAYLRDNTYASLLNLLYKVLLVVLVFNDLFALLGITFRNQGFLVGSKFKVSYVHCFFGALLFQKKKNKWLNIGYLLLSAVICVYVDCYTGVIAVALTLFLSMLNQDRKKKLISIKWALLTWGLVNAIFFGLNAILSNTVVQNILVRFFDTDASLTGRTRIYRYLEYIVTRKPLWGYGYLNNIVSDVVGFGNAQNGTLKLLIDYGAIGAIAFAVLIITSFYKNKKANTITHEKAYPFVVMFYTLMFCSIVEVSFNLYFYFSLAVIYAVTKMTLKDSSVRSANETN